MKGSSPDLGPKYRCEPFGELPDEYSREESLLMAREALLEPARTGTWIRVDGVLVGVEDTPKNLLC